MSTSFNSGADVNKNSLKSKNKEKLFLKMEMTFTPKGNWATRPKLCEFTVRIVTEDYNIYLKSPQLAVVSVIIPVLLFTVQVERFTCI